MTTMDLFTYERQQVRTVLVDGEPVFVLADICAVLDIANVSNVSARVEEDALHTVEVIDSMGRTQQARAVDESGVYEVILLSRKPEARAFKRWITREVLPSIRRTGTYGAPALPQSYAEALRELAATVEAKEVAEQQVQALTPGAAAWDHLASTAQDYSVQQAATILARDPSIRVGRQRLFQWLDGAGWTYRDRGTGSRMAYQRQIEVGRLAHRAVHHIHPRTGEVVLDPPQVRVTVKGMQDLHRALGGSRPLAIEDPQDRLLEIAT